MEYLDCKICNEAYDEEDHRPRNAPCGHELCSVCLASLITCGVFECPKCRHKSNVSSPDDLPVSFGLIDVIRALKPSKISSTIAVDSMASGATNEDVCDIHCKPISHWCNKCILWICRECLETHSELIGCSTDTSSGVIKSMKEKHTKDIDKLLDICDEDVNTLSLKIQNYTEIVEKLGKKFSSWSEEGNAHKDKLVESKKYLNEADSPHSVSERVKILTQRKQILYSWIVRNIGTDSPLGLQKAIKDGNDVYSKLAIKGFKNYAKLTQRGERIYVHVFQTPAVSDDCIIMPFERLQKIFPDEASLLFLELTIGHTVKKPILIRLNNHLPNMREYMLKIFTGQEGFSLNGLAVAFKQWGVHMFHILQTEKLEFGKIPFEYKGSSIEAKKGNVLCGLSCNEVFYIYFHVDDEHVTHNVDNGYVIGHIEDGLDTMQQCHDKHRSGSKQTGLKIAIQPDSAIKITDSGIVIEKD